MNLKLLWYCTKAKNKYVNLKKLAKKIYYIGTMKENSFNGKIVAESDFEVEKITTFKDYTGYEEYDTHYQTAKRDYERLLQETCLNNQQLDDYLQGENGYAIHIKNLNIFDKPKELSSVYRIVDVGGMLLTDTLKKAPQNMMYVSINEWEYGFYNQKDKRVLISVRPEWLCLILNGLKDVELRRKVLKEML